MNYITISVAFILCGRLNPPSLSASDFQSLCYFLAPPEIKALLCTTKVTTCSFSGEAFEQSPLRRSFKSKVLVHYPENTDRSPFNKDAVNMVRA